MAERPQLFNSSQERHLRVTCEYVDQMLKDVETILASSASKSPFPKYIPDISPFQRKVIEDYVARVRARLLRVLESVSIERQEPFIPASRAVHTAVTFMDIAVEELRPRHMRGYGELPETAATELNGIVGEFQALFTKFDEVLIEEEAGDLKGRLGKLENLGSDSDLLKRLERIIDERGLVEYRPTLAMILDRLEDQSFEIAVFGRVSSGKSSLLNSILQMDLLPVGVTPITAVPTRIKYGESPVLEVRFPDKAGEVHALQDLVHFVTERLNPGNEKRVARLVVSVPSPRLASGIVFVDTPGLGSLATSGAAETLNYMPRCDLGVVLVDAGSILTNEDLQIVRALYQAGVPAQVLLSKSDLLKPEDETRMLSYIRDHIRSELGVELSIRPVSSLPGQRKLLDGWFIDDIMPLYSTRRELKLQSVQRKIGGLRRSLIASLKAKLKRSQQGLERPGTTEEVEAAIRQATALIERVRSAADSIADHLKPAALGALHTAAENLIAAWKLKQTTSVDSVLRDAISSAVNGKAAEVRELLVSLASELTQVLNASAHKLRGGDAPAPEEFEVLIREMPALDLRVMNAKVAPSLWRGLLGSGMAVKQLSRELNSQLADQITNELTTYSSLLRGWVRSMIEQLRMSFQAYADAYRAQAETNTGNDTQIEHRQGVERDLRELEEVQAEGKQLAAD